MEKPAPVDHPIHDLLARRWSPRAFSSRPVEAAKLRQLFEAARWAASCYNAQPWRFLVATKDQPEQHARLLACLVEGNQVWARNAPVLAFSVAQTAFEHNGQPNRHAWHDVGLAVANLAIQATALGLAAHQMAGFHADRARDLLAVPEGYELVAGLAIGYADEAEALPEPLRKKETAARSRKPLAEVLHGGAWGEPPAFLVGAPS